MGYSRDEREMEEARCKKKVLPVAGVDFDIAGADDLAADALMGVGLDLFEQKNLVWRGSRCVAGDKEPTFCANAVASARRSNREPGLHEAIHQRLACGPRDFAVLRLKQRVFKANSTGSVHWT